jgi:hypothetical protein
MSICIRIYAAAFIWVGRNKPYAKIGSHLLAYMLFFTKGACTNFFIHVLHMNMHSMIRGMIWPLYLHMAHRMHMHNDTLWCMGQ